MTSLLPALCSGDAPSTTMPKSSAQCLALFCAVWPVIFCPISFGLYYAYDTDNYYREDGIHQIPTISLAGSRMPSSAVLTYGLHLEAFALVLLFVAIHLEVHRRISFLSDLDISRLAEQQPHHISWLTRLVDYTTCLGCRCFCACCNCCQSNKASLHLGNMVAMVLGVFAALCMSIVGSIQLVVNDFAHGTFAFVMFVSGVLHVLVFHFALEKYVTSHHPSHTSDNNNNGNNSNGANNTVINNSRGNSNSTSNAADLSCENNNTQEFWRKLPRVLRDLSILICIPFNILVIILAAIVSGSCSTYSCRAFVVDIGPALEFSTVIGLLAYMLSWAFELGGVELVMVKGDMERCSRVST
ncbi:hypothetical protein EON64_11460, partial [archaeon]